MTSEETAIEHNPQSIARRQASHDEPKRQGTGERIDWRRAHEALSRLAATRAAVDWEEGRSLLYGLRSGAHVHLGFGSFAEYVERLFGYNARWTHEKLRVAEALEQLPELTQRAYVTRCSAGRRCES